MNASASFSRWLHSASMLPLLIFSAAFSVPFQTSAAEPVSYERDIAPILRSYCAGCHNDRELEGGLSVETFAQLMKGGDDHPQPVRPGDAENSFLIRSLEGRARPSMPPRDEPQVPPSDLERLKRWVAEGAGAPQQDLSILRTVVTPKLAPARGPFPFTAIAYSPDGTRMAQARSGTIEIRDAAKDELLRVIDGLPGKVNAAHFSPDGQRLAVATGITGLLGVAQVFDAASGKLIREFGEHADILYDAEFSPDGKLLATGGYDNFIRVWNVETGEQLWGNDVNKGAVFDLAWHHTGALLASASADETVKLWRASDGLRLDTLNQPQGELYSVLFTTDGQHVIAAGADRRIHMWRVQTLQAPGINPVEFSRFAHESPICTIALSAGGDYLLSSALDRSVKLWSLPDLELRHTYPPQSDVAPVATAIPGTDQYRIARLDGSTGTLTVELTIAPPSQVSSLPKASRPRSHGELSKVSESEPNDDPAQANRVTLPALVTGAISAPGDADLFRFSAQAGEVLALEVNAARSKSKLDSRLEILRPDGSPVEQVVLQAVRDSWFTFRGKDSSTSDDFRLHNWMEMELDEYLYANGEVVRLWLYPRGPDSGFKVYPGEGKRFNYFGTTALVHALGAPAYIVNPLPPGSQPAPNGLPVFRLNYVNDDSPRHPTANISRGSRMCAALAVPNTFSTRFPSVRRNPDSKSLSPALIQK
jgi:hypothetical protein